MNIGKSLLTACAALAAYAGAMAAPQLTVSYPVPGSTLDSKEYFASFNLDAGGAAYTVAADAKATLENLETGDVIDCTSFSDFMGMAILVKFNTDDVIENGEYEFTVYPGAVTVDGEANDKLVASYTLSDPALVSGVEYPQIKLLSSNPADGAGVAAIGANSLNRVTFVTDNDAAVNYIGWSLWDVTVAENPEWIYQGSENRIDPNRHRDDYSDQFANGLYISIGGPDQQLIKGHKYELRLTFCGIGYDPETNQYPNAITIEKSTELETSITFEGLTPPTEYSPYEYVNVSPDPDTYVMNTPEQARFTITYSGPVKPASFLLSVSNFEIVNAGTYTALGDVDADGYASMWEFVIDPELAKTLVSPNLSITTKDKDGLYLKGNGGYVFDDYTYSIYFESMIGITNLVSVAPEDNGVVESLSEIIVSNEAGLIMNFGWNASESARIVDMFGTEVRVLDMPVNVEGNDKQMKWTFDPITANGSYAVIIPQYYFSLGEEFDGVSSKQTTFRYIVENGQTGDVAFDIVPASVNPADGSTLEEISSVEMTFDQLTFYPMEKGAPVATLWKVDEAGAETQVAESGIAIENDWYEPTSYVFTFAAPVKEDGTYRLKVARASFCDETFDMEMGTAGRANDELVYTYIVSTGLGIDAVGESAASATVYSVDGRIVMKNANASDIKALPAGIYIVDGKKVAVK